MGLTLKASSRRLPADEASDVRRYHDVRPKPERRSRVGRLDQPTLR